MNRQSLLSGGKIKRIFQAICFAALAMTVPLVSAKNGAGPLQHGTYVNPRSGFQHLDLADVWTLGYRDKPITSLDDLKSVSNWINLDAPASIHWALYRAGKLPYPYAHLNSKQYEWVERKAWYYRKSFTIPPGRGDHYAMLCCDGIDYHARLWLNGELLGTHEGMCGGPTVEVSRLLHQDRPNELVIEVRSANALDPVFDMKGTRASNRTVKGWKLCGGSGAEPWFSVGLWQGVRIEWLPKAHLEEPFLFTRAISAEEAELALRVEVPVGTHGLARSGRHENPRSSIASQRAVAKSLPGRCALGAEFFDPDSGNVLHQVTFPIELYQGRNWVEKTITVPNPRLWWPNGMGSPEHYRVIISLKKDDRPLDRIAFNFGIRSIRRVRSAGPRLADRWADWQFVINGRKLFIKGCDWMPADVLLDLNPSRYRWLLESARDAGIQMLRVWGPGLVEPEAFYDLCDELGIMVWQEFPIGNRVTPNWPQDVWESQVLWNVFRLRNRPSLAVWGGGNEFDPYVEGNTRTIGVLERSVALYDGTRTFFRASPDEGSVHTYPDMDPAWYARLYRYVPYIAETGIHSVAEARSLSEIIDPIEFKNLGQLWDRGFRKSHPELVHHFVEYSPGRVPRMLSRASHIDNMNDPGIENLAEASQIGAGEFYQVLSESMQANYPVTSGLMTWVFKRPWPVFAGIMLLDGFGQPTASYYFLKRTYEPTHVAVALSHLLCAPGETIPITAKILHAQPTSREGLELDVRVLDDHFRELRRQQRSSIKTLAGPSVTTAELGRFTIPRDFNDRFFFVVADLRGTDGKLISRSVYWPRVLRRLSDQSARRQWRRRPRPWPYFKEGPWLKPTVQQTATHLTFRLLSHERRDDEHHFRVALENTGDAPAFPVVINVVGLKRLFRASDNFFWLSPGESREVTITMRPRESTGPARIGLTAGAWNAPTQEIIAPHGGESHETRP